MSDQYRGREPMDRVEPRQAPALQSAARGYEPDDTDQAPYGAASASRAMRDEEWLRLLLE